MMSFKGVDPGTARVLIERGEANMTEKLENSDRDDKQVLGGELGQDKQQQMRRDETIGTCVYVCVFVCMSVGLSVSMCQCVCMCVE